MTTRRAITFGKIPVERPRRIRLSRRPVNVRLPADLATVIAHVRASMQSAVDVALQAEADLMLWGEPPSHPNCRCAPYGLGND